jgi:hypothetical protein
MPGIDRSPLTAGICSATASSWCSTVRIRFYFPDFSSSLRQSGPQQAGHAAGSVLKENSYGWHDLARARRNQDAELAQQTAHGIQPRGTCR